VKNSSGHNANLLYPDADLLGVAVAYNENTRYKSYWAMVIGHKASKPKTRTASGSTYNWGSSGGGEGGASLTGAAASVGDAIKRALSPLRSLLP